MKTKILYRALQILLGLTLVGIGSLLGYMARLSSEPEQTGFALVEQASSLLNENYLGELPEPIVLQRGMIGGMVEKVGDPFTTYVEPASNELQGNNLAGRFGGIGAQLAFDNDGNAFLIPFSEGPAADSGVIKEDVLIAIDGVDIVLGMSADEIIALIRGPVGSSALLTFKSSSIDAEPYEIEIIRSEIDIPSVASFIVDEIGVIDIDRFSARTPQELAVAYIVLDDASVEGLILDLRGNTGGLLDAAIEVARFFLEEGVILTDRERGGIEHIYEVESPGEATALPLVVLVDHQTASASEVVAAAIRDNGRGMLLGETTYGKGSVQSILTLSDGSSLHVTIARWMTPLGSSIDGIGLLPDFVETGDADFIFQAGIDALRREIGDS
jgi:carboxyl-terminal processing protease